MHDGWRRCPSVRRGAAQPPTPLWRCYPHLEGRVYSQAVRQRQHSQLWKMSFPFQTPAPSARRSQPPRALGVGPKAILAAPARTRYMCNVSLPSSRWGLLHSCYHVSTSYQCGGFWEQPLPLRLGVSLPDSMAPFWSSKVMTCPARAESLLPGKGLGTVRSYFIIVYYSCRKKYWILGLYQTTNSWSG